jgi:hypothetical protein
MKSPFAENGSVTASKCRLGIVSCQNIRAEFEMFRCEVAMECQVLLANLGPEALKNKPDTRLRTLQSAFEDILLEKR